MHADNREDAWIFLGKLDSAPTARQRCTDRDDSGDPGFIRTAKHVIEIAGEIRIIEVRVSLNKLRVES
jgi:hypothetical protein